MPIIREQRRIFNQPIGVRSFDTGEAQVSNAVSRLANTMGKEFYEKAATNAEKFGAEAAQSISAKELKAFDSSTGKPEVLSQMKGMGSIASASFERVVERRFVDSIDKDIRLKSAELASKYEDPVQYQSMFESYLSSMSTGAGDRFKNIIFDSGSYVMGQTKIRLADAARTKARASAAQAVGTNNIEFAEKIYDTASAGDFTTSVAYIEERVTASLEAENAELYNPGYADKVRSELGSQAMSGALEVALQGATSIQQASIKVYIGSQGKAGGESLSKTQLEALKPFIGYVDRTNTGALLSQANVISSNYNAVTAAKVAEEKAKYEASKAKFLANVRAIEYVATTRIEQREASNKDYIENFSLNYGETNIVPDRFGNTAAIRAAWDSGSLESIAGSIQSAQTTYEKNLNELAAARSIGLGKEEYSSFKQDSRRAGLDAVVLGMASDGNIGALKVALLNGTPENIKKLSPRQQIAIEQLAKTRLYDPTEDRSYVSTLLSGTEDANRKKVDKSIRNADLFLLFENESTRFLNGAYDTESVLNLEEVASNALFDGDITETDFQTLSKSLRVNAGKGIANIASGNMTSSDLRVLTAYVKKGGEETLGLTPSIARVGNLILNIVPAEGRSSVGNHINSVRETVSGTEAEIEAERKAINQTNKVLTGGGKAIVKKDRITQSQILSKKGFVLTDPSTYANPERKAELYQALRETPSQDLIDGLLSISSGLNTPGAEALLDIFATMSNDLEQNGVFVNRFGTGDAAAISAKNVAFLQSVNEIRKVEGGSARDIAINLAARADDDKAKANVKRVFKDQTPAQYLASEFGSDIIAIELREAAEYLALMGGSEEYVKGRLEALVDSNYSKTRVVIDPRFPVGELSRTMYSLEKTFPNQDRRDAFIDIIVSQLPDGYRLKNHAVIDTETIQVPADIAMEGNLDLQISKGVTAKAVGGTPREKDVYLVPNESTTGVAYYAYYVDDTDGRNELVPLYMNINGEQGIPMWDESELADYDKQAIIDAKEKAEATLDVRESVLEAVRKRPGMRSFSEISNITFGSGGN